MIVRGVNLRVVRRHVGFPVAVHKRKSVIAWCDILALADLERHALRISVARAAIGALNDEYSEGRCSERKGESAALWREKA